ncbi:hypothetical protein RRG08_053892 [Elysia crispata]|uniref:Vacuolar protein sorting-associated protein 13 VPS13 adaptor binding domain-containing protein n=1 Tax=Elysia crispata TaxID=231223 RepID=A0AAE0ZN89_9GAST|nr:hypothetical protein RRG08_053892 [Elysia crispata]
MVEGFEQTKTYLHKRARRTLVPLSPIKNGIQYCILLEVDIWHARKTISFSSPLVLENHLNMTINLFCKTEDLKRLKATLHLAGASKFSKLMTVEPEETYCLPLFVAYHCPVYASPADIGYDLTFNALWWKEMLQGRDKVKSFTCLSTEEDKKSFHFKVMCQDGSPLTPAQKIPRALPYYTLSLHPPVILHNLLPYDVHFSLQDTTWTSLKHGHKTPIYTADPNKSSKLNLKLPDYMGSDWTGTLEISHDMHEFRAIAMETEVNYENMNRQLSLGIHIDNSTSLDLHIYSPYWVVNKTGLPLQIRGSLSEAIYEFCSSPNPLLFRFKKHKRKKAKLRVYESRWSQSFSTDTVGSGGVVVCHDKERGKKYMSVILCACICSEKVKKLILHCKLLMIIQIKKTKLYIPVLFAFVCSRTSRVQGPLLSRQRVTRDCNCAELHSWLCQKIWHNLRSSFTRRRAQQYAPSGSDAKKKPSFYLAHQLSFLEPHLAHVPMKGSYRNSLPAVILTRMTRGMWIWRAKVYQVHITLYPDHLFTSS